jgi:GGDEF domain-containing protein
MIAHRRTWLYRLAGEEFAHAITFKIPVTARMVREELRKAFGASSFELWAR